MKILIACEESQTVCKEMRLKGHEAYSCDLAPCSGGHPEWHIQGDVSYILNGRCTFQTAEGGIHSVERWDMIIAHPPCTYLSNVATRWFSLRCTEPEKVVSRWDLRARGAVFFMTCMFADCDKVCVENPIGYMNSAFRKPDQIIHPYMFADSVEDKENYVTKATCLWIKGLPELETNGLPKPNNAEIFGRLTSGKARTWEDTYSRKASVRSKTFSGIARAMAEQWG